MDGCRLFRYVVLWSVVVGIQNRQCPDGFYGNSCQHKCPVTCNNQQCKIDEFGRASCIDGCVDGYRGTSCKIPCPVNCRVCERVNGSCINCKETFHGTNCTLTCEELCQGFRCDTDQTCSKTTCLDGRYGQNCSNKCYPRYLTCSPSTGGCTACRDGYYGQFCEHDCPRCGFTDGSLDQTCKDGCNTISCSDITGGDCGKSIPLIVFVPVVLLLVIAIAVILCLSWRSHYKFIRKYRETDEEVQLRMLKAQRIRDVSNAEHTSDRGSIWYLASAEPDLITTSELDQDNCINHPPPESADEEITSESEHRASDPYSHVADSNTDYGYYSTTTSQDIGSFDSGLVTFGTSNYDDDGSDYISIQSNISVCVDSKDEPALQRVTK